MGSPWVEVDIMGGSGVGRPWVEVDYGRFWYEKSMDRGRGSNIFRSIPNKKRHSHVYVLPRLPITR